MKGKDLTDFFARMMLDEGATVIQPYPEPFRPYQRDFLEGLRRIPAHIAAPPGRNPYSMAMGKPGRWVIAWIPDE